MSQTAAVVQVIRKVRLPCEQPSSGHRTATAEMADWTANPHSTMSSPPGMSWSTPALTAAIAPRHYSEAVAEEDDDSYDARWAWLKRSWCWRSRSMP
jgi:hypothetical protein